MWARWIEIILGMALILLPRWLDYNGAGAWQWNVALCGALVIAFASLSFTRHWRSLHRATLAVALWLSAAAYFTGGHPAAPRAQAELTIGLMLLMFAIIPSDASLPSPAWREFDKPAADL